MSDDREEERNGEVIAIDPAGSIDRVIARVIAAGTLLRAASDARVIAAIARAASILSDPTSPLGREARGTIPARSGLSSQNVELALETTLSELRAPHLEAAVAELARAHGVTGTRPARLAAMVLAGNVFTAAIRPIAWAMLARVPLVIKPSSDDEGLAELFAIALTDADPELADSIALLRFARGETSMLGAMASRSDVLHAWGSDRSIVEIRAALPATTAFVAHGHGLGAVYVPARALASVEQAAQVAARIALDVALYDQRGCLSPQFVLVERGARVTAVELARMLSDDALAARERAIPRGALPLAVGAAQIQWRGVGAVRGDLFEGDTWAVTYEGDHALRVTPGWRNLAVHDVGGPEELGERLARFGVHLKALGIAEPLERRREIARALPPSVTPRVSDVGAMQTPGLLASADGERPWSGLVRLVDVD